MGARAAQLSEQLVVGVVDDVHHAVAERLHLRCDRARAYEQAPSYITCSNGNELMILVYIILYTSR